MPDQWEEGNVVMGIKESVKVVKTNNKVLSHIVFFSEVSSG